MKLKFIFSIIAVAMLCTIGYSQSVVITGKNVTYKRVKPIADYKKTFTIDYPKVKASTPTLSKKIEAAISYQKVLGLKLNEELSEYQWLETADYAVGYNKNGILSISLSMEGSGAYPSTTTKYVVVDLKTGLRATPAMAFTNTARLLSLVKKAREKEIAEAIVEIKKDKANDDYPPDEFFKDSYRYHPVKLNEFSVSDKGITFHYDYGFPHVSLALQPPGEFFYTWAQLKPYIKAGGLLSRFKR